MTAKEKTSLYAGEIYIKIGDIVIRPSSVTIKKSLTTVTDTFSFTVPMWNDNGDVVQIPNIFGLTIDVYVNDTFYVGGILLRRIVQDNDIYCECSTHGWQLDNSEILSEFEANTKTLQDFILDTCEKNFDQQIFITASEAMNEKRIQNIIDGENYFNTILSKMNIGQSIHAPILFFMINKANVFLKTPLCEKRKIEFIIYDPYDLGTIKLSDYIVTEDKKNKIKSQFGQTVFEYIKSVTKNINVFVKCIGLYDQIKDRLATEKIWNHKELKETGHIVYVLLLYRPGIDKDIYNGYFSAAGTTQPGQQKMYTDEGVQATLEKATIYKDLAPQTVPIYTRQFYKTIGSVFNDKTKADRCNCLQDPVEEYNGTNQYSCYILLDKNKKPFIFRERDLQDKEITKKLKKQGLIVPIYQYDRWFNLGTYKTIKVEKSLTDIAAKVRLIYEVNKAKAESYKVTVKVIGFTMDMNFAKTHYSENIGTNFWDFGKLVHVYSPKQMLDMFLTVEEMEMHYDSQEGAYTNLTLTYPFSYSAEEILSDSEVFEMAVKDIQKNEKYNYFKASWKALNTMYKLTLNEIVNFSTIIPLNEKSRKLRQEQDERQTNIRRSLTSDLINIARTGYTTQEIKDKAGL